MTKRKVSKIILAALMVSAIGAMSAMPAFAANTVITNGTWTNSDYVSATNLGTARLTMLVLLLV